MAGFIMGCQNTELPSNPTLTSPISGLVLTVNNEDYIATPMLNGNNELSDTLLLSVKIPSRFASIKSLSFSDTSYSSNIKVGDQITFENNVFAVDLAKNGQNRNYYIKMSYNPPPFMYFIKSSDKDVSGNRYYLSVEKANNISSGTYDSQYEGYVDLTNSNWDNIGLITSDKTVYYDYNGGAWPAVSYYEWTGTPEKSPMTGYYPCNGPWNNWKFTNNNSEITSPGVWKINFNSETKKVTMLEVQWAIAGSAVSKRTAMKFDSSLKQWSIKLAMSVGTFHFTTIPIASSDPSITYGLSTGISQLSEGGSDISVSEAGTYTVTLSLFNPPYYVYSISK